MIELLPREHPTQLIDDWLQEHPEKALKIARSALTVYFVDNDENGQPAQLNPKPNLDSATIDESLFASIEQSKFRKDIWNCNMS